MCIEHTTEACLLNHCCHGKAVGIIYSECVSVALVTQHAMHMCRIVLLSVVCRLYPIFLHYLINGMIFGKKNVIEHNSVF